MEPNGPALGDAVGASFKAFWEQEATDACLLVERDDGFISCDPVGAYFSGWSDLEAAGADRIGHRVLDIGAGAGRHTIELQDRGHEVLALDTSPGALEVCRSRGVESVFVGTAADLAATRPEPFDTLLLFGHNLGLLGSPDAAEEFLTALKALCRHGGVVVGTGRDPSRTEDPLHLAYHERNIAAGRMPGQLHLRLRWRNTATEWFDLLLASPRDLEDLIRPHGWSIADRALDGPSYLAVLRPPPD